MNISIIQGNDKTIDSADITIVIDVLRAFSVTHEAFIKGAEKVILLNSSEDVLKLKSENPDYIAVGEIKGRYIPGFDFGNSPTQLEKANLKNKTIILKTTNGVKSTLNALNSKEIYVTGLTNAYTTANHIKKITQNLKNPEIIIISSHPSSDDDFACAEYIEQIIKNNNRFSIQEIQMRIQNSFCAEKFLRDNDLDFPIEDLEFCNREIESNFVMKVEKSLPVSLKKIEVRV